MADRTFDIDEMLQHAERGGETAVNQLLETFRPRLRKMVTVYLHPRLSSRLDPSDIVQETMMEAAQRLHDYMRERPLPFYPWLRSLASDRLIDMHRRHIGAGKRSVLREEPDRLELSNQSVLALAQRLAASGTSPSKPMQRSEQRAELRAALEQLDRLERELLVLRYLEELPAAEVAEILSISDRTYRRRHRQALARLSELLPSTDRKGNSRADQSSA